MKILKIIILILIALWASDVVAQRLYANELTLNNSLILDSYQITGIDNTTGLTGGLREVPTSQAVADYVAATAIATTDTLDVDVIGDVDISNQRLDAFGALRVSQPYTQFEIKNTFGKDTLTTIEQFVSGGSSAWDANTRSVVMSVTTTTGSKSITQSRRNAIYQNGKGLRAELTGVLATATNADLECNVGLFDDNNGFMFRYRGDSLFVVKRSKVTGTVVDTEVYQGAWDNDTSYIPDVTKAQIFFIDLQYLGVGTVRMGFVEGTTFHIVHTFEHANIVTTPYTQTPSLPIRYEIEQLGSTTPGNMRMICAVAISDGGFAPVGRRFSYNNGIVTPRAVTSSADSVLVALRADSVYVTLSPISMDIMTTSNAYLVIDVYLCSTVSGGTWTQGSTNSNASVNTTITSYTPIAKVSSFHVASQNRTAGADLENRVFTGNTFNKNDIIVVTARASTNANVFYSIDWMEFY